ncbi:OmpA family protein [Luteirhabdus pelagi]|uniref:OmpA family protein n=1 Tax=Luteirhabdus pelagi TaxID=2792783 RepID=UPI001F3AED67|nr:OmpA family protein [Luteirhabdus pelagi]
MRKVLPLLMLFSVMAFAQEEDMMNASESSMETTDNSFLKEYDKWAIEASVGIHKPTRQFAPGYYTNTPSFGLAQLGVRYNFNPDFGVRLGLGYNNIESDDEALPFKSSYYRASLEGVLNMTSILNFSDWTDTFGLQIHGGGGYAVLDHNEPAEFDENDNILHIMAGITPQIRLTNSIALFADVTAVGNVRQYLTWDGTQRNDGRGVNGFMVNASAGLTFYLGGNEKHADWFSEDKAYEEKLAELNNRVDKLETDLIDSDQDGVPDYLDREPNTVSGVTVDTKGVAVDKNKNGIPDEIEGSLDARYVNEEDYKVTDEGYGMNVKKLLNEGYVNVYFRFNSDVPETYSLEAINYLTLYMKENPSANAELIGYADEIGNQAYNERLSERRAKRVHDILVAAGINADRIEYRGGGEDTSVEKSSAPARQLVRRVTFKIK